jgi:hypothetical protein
LLEPRLEYILAGLELGLTFAQLLNGLFRRLWLVELAEEHSLEVLTLEVNVLWRADL